jgi:glycine cleavage system transcriptional repressor
MGSHVAVTAIGNDRPGIVAAVAGVLFEHRANIEDSSMTILRGHFAMMLVVALADGDDASALEAAVAAATDGLDLVVTVRPIDDGGGEAIAGEAWNLAVYGADRTGIVQRVTQLLADLSVNVVDLTTRVIGDDDRPAYVMLLELTVPEGTDLDQLRAQLTAAGRDLGVECSLHESEADIF